MDVRACPIVSSGGAAHINTTIDPATLSGTWSNDLADGGSFAFNGTAPGDPRGSPLGAQWATAYFVKTTGGGRFVGLRHNGMVGAPTAAQQGDYVQFEGGGHTGQAFTWPTAAISMVAAENWTPTAQGTRMFFSTARNRRRLRDHQDADRSQWLRRHRRTTSGRPP